MSRLDMNCRVLLADDHKQFREALHSMLRRQADIEVVGEAGDGIEMVDLVRALLPDVVVTDIRMPRLTGVAAIAQLLAVHPSLKIIVLSVNSARIFATQMLAAGARGYVTKSDAEELPRAIRAVAGDGIYLSTEVAAVNPADPDNRAQMP